MQENVKDAEATVLEGAPPPGEPGPVPAQAPAPEAQAFVPGHRRARGLSLAQVLVEAGILTPEQVAKAQETAHREHIPLGRVLVREGLVLSRDLAALTAVHLGLTMVDLRSQEIDRKATALLAEEMARRYVALPIRKDNGRLIVAMTDPTDLQLLQDVAVRTGAVVEPVIATPEDILEHIDIAYRLTEVSGEGEAGGEEKAGGGMSSKLLRDAPPAEVLDILVKQAIHDRASDIHLAPGESRMRVRFRIDGILHDVVNVPLIMHPMLMSRLKIMTGLNIAERRRPQDGQFTAEVQGRKVDVRVAISSTVHGEMAVLRLLDKKFTVRGLDQLGFSAQGLEQFRKLLRLPYGMIIVCGPTGAGKSTTLYASILQMNRIEQNVISIEDPVEYRITDVNQMQVHPEAGITFAGQLRSILRLDPDVVLVGEIRDNETATIATQAALTGHLVLTSLHANDAVSALLRLKDLGVAPYLIASSVAGIIAQRMVRQVCPGCRTLVPRPAAEQQAYASEMGVTQEQFVYGSGCNQCAQTGYRGRTGVFEVMTMTDGLRQLFLNEAPRSDLFKQALGDGMVHLRRDAMLKVKGGVTTPYEVMRVLFSLD